MAKSVRESKDWFNSTQKDAARDVDTSRFTESTHDTFSKVNSKYRRMLDPVKMESMLSRKE